MASKTAEQKKAMLAALEKTLGIVTTACVICGVARRTHYGWMKRDKKYRAAVEELNEVAIDYAESKLHNRITKNDTTAIIFYLKTKAKKRGYIERVEQAVDINQRSVIIDTTGDDSEGDPVHPQAGGSQANSGT
jgi:hypothetical protein